MFLKILLLLFFKISTNSSTSRTWCFKLIIVDKCHYILNLQHSKPIHKLNDQYVMPHGCKQFSICHMSISRTNIQVLLDNSNKPTNGAFSQAQMFDHGVGFWQHLLPFYFQTNFASNYLHFLILSTNRFKPTKMCHLKIFIDFVQLLFFFLNFFFFSSLCLGIKNHRV